MRTMPTCSPFGPTRRTSGTRMRSLMRGSLIAAPYRCFLNDLPVGALPQKREKAPARTRAEATAATTARHTAAAGTETLVLAVLGWEVDSTCVLRHLPQPVDGQE